MMPFQILAIWVRGLPSICFLTRLHSVSEAPFGSYYLGGPPPFCFFIQLARYIR
jgi:hypothetical protein